MAVVTLKGTAITNADATPRVLNVANIENGNLRESQGFAAITSGDSVGSTYRFARLRSSDRVSQILFWAPDIGTTTAGSVGLYRTAADGGAVVSSAFFASAQSLNGGPYVGIDITFQSGAAGGLITNGEKRIWEMLGLASDPGYQYDVALTLTGAADATGTALFRVRFTSGE